MLDIIIGTGAGDPRKIAEPIQAEGFGVVLVSDYWPRDHYVCTGPDNYVVVTGGLPNIAMAGEGGYFRTGREFLLCSDLCLSDTDWIQNHEQATKRVTEELEPYYQDIRKHIFPTGCFHGEEIDAHIDLFTLLLDTKKILMVDTYDRNRDERISVCRNEQWRDAVESIAEKEGLELLWYDGRQDGVWYPLNSACIPTGPDSEVVIVDAEARKLRHFLESEGVETIPVPCDQQLYPGGKINCATNIVYRDEGVMSGLSLTDMLRRLDLIAYSSDDVRCLYVKTSEACQRGL